MNFVKILLNWSNLSKKTTEFQYIYPKDHDVTRNKLSDLLLMLVKTHECYLFAVDNIID